MATPHQERQTLEINAQEYEVESYTALEPIEAIRRRPTIYIGDTGATGLHSLVFELLNCAMDEAHAGHCDRVMIVLHEDGSCSVKDNGRGIPVYFDQDSGADELEFTRPSTGGPFRIGLVIVNALSEWFTVKTRRGSLVWSRRYEKGGLPTGPLTPKKETTERGTTICFKPDPNIFGETAFSFEELRDCADDLVFGNPDLMFVLEDKRDHRTYLCGRGTRLVL